MDILSIYSRADRRFLLLAAIVLVAAIAFTDWFTKPYISIGFLYLFPIMLVSGILRRWQIVCVALVCAILQEVFSNLPSSEAIVRLILSSAGFVGTGLFVFELVRNRRIVMQHLEEVEGQIRLRQEAEEQLRVLVESSPAAILTIDSKGEILLANQAAQEILASGERGAKIPVNSKVSSCVVDRRSLKTIPAFQDNHAMLRATGGRRDLPCGNMVCDVQHTLRKPAGSDHRRSLRRACSS